MIAINQKQLYNLDKQTRIYGKKRNHERPGFSTPGSQIEPKIQFNY
jgi:hypothetical protein